MSLHTHMNKSVRGRACCSVHIFFETQTDCQPAMPGCWKVPHKIAADSVSVTDCTQDILGGYTTCVGRYTACCNYVKAQGRSFMQVRHMSGLSMPAATFMRAVTLTYVTPAGFLRVMTGQVVHTQHLQHTCVCCPKTSKPAFGETLGKWLWNAGKDG